MPGTLLAALGITALASGCGADNGYRNAARPPAPILVTASIGPKKVSVSPRRFGAGAIRLIVTNQTDAPQQVTFDPARGPAVSAGPLNPSATATLKIDVPRGRATLRVSSETIDPAMVTVGAERASAQDDLLQP